METGWLADYVYHRGAFESGVAMFANDAGEIVRFSREPADLERAHKLARRAIVPGLVNVHSHTFQRVIRGRTEHRTAANRDTFWTWREAMYHAATRLSPEDIYHAARMTFVEMLRAGITAVSEFHYLHHQPDGTPYQDRALLSRMIVRGAEECGIRLTLLETAYVRAGWQKEPNPGQARFLSPTPEDFLRLVEAARGLGVAVGIAPHSVRAVPLGYLREILPYAREHAMQVHMHVAEQPGEIQECIAEHGCRPVELLADDVLDDRFTGVHVIHVTREEIGAIAAAKARVCACPTTERNLGDGIGPSDELLNAGVEICFGSDSNAQIDFLEDARQFEYHMRLKKLERAVLPGEAAQLLKCATAGESLDVGRAADFFTVDLDDLSIAGAEPGALLANIVFAADRTAIRDVFVGGRAVLEDGRHRLEETVVREFAEVQRRLWGS